MLCYDPAENLRARAGCSPLPTSRGAESHMLQPVNVPRPPASQGTGSSWVASHLFIATHSTKYFSVADPPKVS